MWVVMSESRQAEDADLLRRTCEGDERAFEVFYRRYQPAVVGYHYRRTGDRELAMDLTMETFAAVLEAAPRYEDRHGHAGGWVFGIASNKLKQSLRRRRVESRARRRLDLPVTQVTDGDLLRVEELATEGDEEAIARMLADLPEGQRAAIFARVIEDLPYADVAKRLRCSEAVARQRVTRGLKALRNRMEPTDERI